jgi:hypothetical protein
MKDQTNSFFLLIIICITVLIISNKNKNVIQITVLEDF